MAAFSQFASDLDDATRAQLSRGERVTELMKQGQYSPMSVAEMAVTLFAVNEGYFDDVDTKQVGTFEAAMQALMKSNFQTLIDDINKAPKLTDEVTTSLNEALADFKKNGSW